VFGDCILGALLPLFARVPVAVPIQPHFVFCSIYFFSHQPTDSLIHGFTTHHIHSFSLFCVTPSTLLAQPYQAYLNFSTVSSGSSYSSRYMLHDVHRLASPAAPIGCHVGLPLSQLLIVCRLPSVSAPVLLNF
jgi:hypothetical protein